MVSYLSQYHGGYRIFTVIKEKEKADEWLSAGLSVGILNNDSLTLMPDGMILMKMVLYTVGIPPTTATPVLQPPQLVTPTVLCVLQETTKGGTEVIYRLSNSKPLSVICQRICTISLSQAENPL